MARLRLADDGYAQVDRVAFGQQLRLLRTRAGLSQTELALRTGINPAYVNRMERGTEQHGRPGNLPSRAVVLGLWEVLHEAFAAGPADRERLLVLAGHCPEVILALGGWDQYLDRVRAGVDEAPVDAP